MYICMPAHSLMITCSSTPWQAGKISHKGAFADKERCWPIVFVSSSSVYCSEGWKVAKNIYSSVMITCSSGDKVLLSA